MYFYLKCGLPIWFSGCPYGVKIYSVSIGHILDIDYNIQKKPTGTEQGDLETEFKFCMGREQSFPICFLTHWLFF